MFELTWVKALIKGWAFQRNWQICFVWPMYDPSFFFFFFSSSFYENSFWRSSEWNLSPKTSALYQCFILGRSPYEKTNYIACLSFFLPFSSNLLYSWTPVYVWLEDLCFTLIITVLFDWIISSLVSMLNVIRNARTKHFNAYFWIKFHLISSSEMSILMPVWIYSEMFCLIKQNLLQG